MGIFGPNFDLIHHFVGPTTSWIFIHTLEGRLHKTSESTAGPTRMDDNLFNQVNAADVINQIR